MANLGSNKKRGRVDNRKPLDIKIKIFVIIFICYSFFLAGWIYGLIDQPTEQEYKSELYEIYLSHSEDFYNDDFIMNVTNTCLSSNNKPECVFLNIPYKYNDRDGLPSFVTTDEYLKFGGLCRDITLIRYAILDNLGVECIFNFNTPNHVYLTCFYDDKVYELNNGRMTEND